MKALIAMSGGVDSSVAAMLAKNKGYECIGVTMSLFDRDEPAADINDAASVSARLNIPHEVCGMKCEFKSIVMEGFADSYMKGETPNPCIVCNRRIKFGGLMDKAKELGCEKIITGHYARISYNGETGRYELKKGLDETKDQSYVLYGLSQEQLGAAEFPLGEFTKEECRKMAAEMGFSNAYKKDSQDICFIPDGDYRAFLERFTGKPMPEGNFVDTKGNVLGRHKGISSYTIGQRKGLGIALGRPAFVKEIRPKTNEIVLSGNDELFTDTVYVKDFNLSAWGMDEFTEAEKNGKTIMAKLRYRHKAATAKVCTVDIGRLPEEAAERLKNDNSGYIIRLDFDKPQRAVTPGQAAVIYDGDRVAGGGTIFWSENR